MLISFIASKVGGCGKVFYLPLQSRTIPLSDKSNHLKLPSPPVPPVHLSFNVLISKPDPGEGSVLDGGRF